MMIGETTSQNDVGSKKEQQMNHRLALRFPGLMLAGLVLGVSGGVVMAIEEAAYTVEKTDGDFQVRRYAPQVVAETIVEGSLKEAGNKAFRPLFRYISGANRSQSKIPMTAPVTQEREGEKIAMTAPVSQQAMSNRWSVTFMMPTNSTLESLPEPTDEKVRLRAIPVRRMAVVRYSGTWGEKRYERQLTRLREWMKANGMESLGEPVWSRYDPPFTLWFMRRNEILLPIVKD